MITADQLVCHLVGDYVLQSDWQALNKTKRAAIAVLHGFVYAVPFLFLQPSLMAFLVIGLTHAVIDRYSLAKYLCWFKNIAGSPQSDFHTYRDTDGITGYRANRPDFIRFWLYVIADNTLHILINGLALRYLHG